MARRAEYYTQVGSGENARSVGYSASQRGEYLGVRFTGLNGERFEKMTGCKKADANFHIEAAKLIAKAFAPVYPATKKATWDDAMKVLAADLRPDTHIAYAKAVRIFRDTLQEHAIAPHSPGVVTAELAAQFSKLWLSGTYKRGKGSDAKEYKRKPTTLAFYLRQLSAVWEQWLPLGYVRSNPWKGVRKPKTDQQRKPVPTEDQTAQFFTWVRDRYPEWERLHALLELKAYTVCRTKDICSLRSAQVQNGRVTWDASQVKQREGRSVVVPDDLYHRLKRLAGPTHLWEHFPADLARFRPSKNTNTDHFSPATVAHVIGNIFREFSDAHADQPRLSPHSLRRRGITLTVAATGSVDATAQAIGITPACAKSYYLDAERAFATDTLFQQMAGVLLPKTAPQIPRKSGDIGEQRGASENNGLPGNA